jgi:hypothetical protein
LLSADIVKTQVVSYGRSVALIASDTDHSYVALAAAGAPVHGWVPGVEAAWASERDAYVRTKDGTVTRYSINGDTFMSEATIHAGHIFQTASGAVAQTPSGLERISAAAPKLPVPAGARVLAVSPSGDRALVDHRGPALWDGHEFKAVDIDGFDVLGASFERSGERVAVTLRREGVLTVAVVDQQGNAALKPLGTSDHGCPAVGAWDAAGRWLYVTPGDGLMYAVEVSGGRIERVPTRSVGCGIAWLAD